MQITESTATIKKAACQRTVAASRGRSVFIRGWNPLRLGAFALKRISATDADGNRSGKDPLLCGKVTRNGWDWSCQTEKMVDPVNRTPHSTESAQFYDLEIPLCDFGFSS